MEAVSSIRPGFLGVLLVVVRLSVLVSVGAGGIGAAGGSHIPGPSQPPQNCWTLPICPSWWNEVTACPHPPAMI